MRNDNCEARRPAVPHMGFAAGDFATLATEGAYQITENTRMEMLKGWRTVIVAVAVGAVGALQTVGWADIIPVGYVGPVMMGLGIIMAYLRSQTDTPVGVK